MCTARTVHAELKVRDMRWELLVRFPFYAFPLILVSSMTDFARLCSSA